MTARELSEKLGINRETVKRWISGEYSVPAGLRHRIIDITGDHQILSKWKANKK